MFVAAMFYYVNEKPFWKRGGFMWKLTTSLQGETIPWYRKFSSFAFWTLPIDQNIAGQRITSFSEGVMSNPVYQSSPVMWRKFGTAIDQECIARTERCKKLSTLLKLPLIRYRSEYVGDHFVSFLGPVVQAAYNTLVRAGTLRELTELAVALERFQKDNGKYPGKLDELAPKYIDEVPLDPFTGKYTITYKKTEKGFIVYSFGRNEKDDGGKQDITEGDFLDIVFER